ncbi:MAG: uracil-DNA glycosylase family protein [Caulobacteraceae bacterium]
MLGLAPGRKGANRTGRPFTGDYAGKLLYETLDKFGFSEGTFDARVDDGVVLKDCMLSNAVRCAPPGNKPEPNEEATCRQFLTARLAALPRLKAIVCLGDVSRRNVLRAIGLKGSAAPPGHGLQFQAGSLPAVLQLPLLAPQHEHRPSDHADVRSGLRRRAGLSGWSVGLGAERACRHPPIRIGKICLPL